MTHTRRAPGHRGATFWGHTTRLQSPRAHGVFTVADTPTNLIERRDALVANLLTCDAITLADLSTVAARLYAAREVAKETSQRAFANALAEIILDTIDGVS